jgi:hypothetical protein
MPGSNRWIGGNWNRWYGETPHQHDEPFDDYHGSHAVLRSTRSFAKTVIFDRDNPPAPRSGPWSGD